MKKTIIYLIIGVVAILVVGVTVKVAQDSSETDTPTTTEKTSTGNPASEIGENEFKITDDNFQAEISDYKGVSMVDIFLPTCSYCQQVGPVITEISDEYAGVYKIGKLDASENSKTASEFKVESVPALIFFKDGEEVDRLIGAQEKEVIVAKLQELSK